MSGHERRFRYRLAVLLTILTASAGLLIQQRAMANDVPPLRPVAAPSLLVMPLPPAPAIEPETAPPAPTPAAKPSPARATITRNSGKRVLMMEVTAYCPCKQCCGKNARGVTASGRKVSHNNGAFVAADTRLLPFDTRLSIPGYRSGKAVPVIDRGGDIKGHRLDVFFSSHAEAKKFGRRIVPVTVHN